MSVRKTEIIFDRLRQTGTLVMGQLMLTLNAKEEELLEGATPADEESNSFSRQDLIRALLLITSDNEGLLKEAQQLAAEGEKIHAELRYRPGESKGLSEEDYREAVKEEGSIKGAAEMLGVTRTSVREQCVRYNIYVPSIKGVPE